MQALQRQQHIGGIEAGGCVAEGALDVQVVEQLTTRDPLLRRQKRRKAVHAEAVSDMLDCVDDDTRSLLACPRQSPHAIAAVSVPKGT
jgi:hypothetical protein